MQYDKMPFEEIEEAGFGRIGTLIELVWIFDDLYQGKKLPALEDNFDSMTIKKELYNMSKSIVTYSDFINYNQFVSADKVSDFPLADYLDKLKTYAEPRMIELWGMKE